MAQRCARRACLNSLLGVLLLGTLGSACPDPQVPVQTYAHQKACQEYLDQAAGDADDARREETLTQAETRCRLCMEYSRANPECLNLTGLVWFMRGNHDQARDFYKRALRSRNDFPEALNNLGILFMEQQPPDYGEACGMFRRAIRIDPGYTPGRWNLSLALSRLGDAAYAAADNRAAAAGLNRGDPKALWGMYLPAEEQYRATDDQLRRLLEMDPGNFQARFLMGYMELKRSNYAPTEDQRRKNLQRAIEMGTRCWELAPKDRVEARQCAGTVGAAYAATEQSGLAMVSWMNCLSLDPKDPECLRGFRDAASREMIRQHGIKSQLDQIAQHPGDAQGYFNLCSAAFEQGLEELGASACGQALQLDDATCLAHKALANHHTRMLDQARAVTSCRAFVACAGSRHSAEVQECRDLVKALEMGPLDSSKAAAE